MVRHQTKNKTGKLLKVMFKQLNKKLIKILMWVSVALVAGCATTQQTERVAKIDPFESINRAVFTFNENADEYVIKPVAEAYQFVLPEFVRTGVTNFFSNIGTCIVTGKQIGRAHV